MTDPTIITCQYCLDQLDDYRRRALPEADMAAMHLHLTSCTACSDELAEREALSGYLRQPMPESAIPNTLPAGVISAIKANNKPTRKSRRSSALPWMLAAAVFIITGISFLQIRKPQLGANSDIAMTTSRPKDHGPSVKAKALDAPSAAPVPEASFGEASVSHDHAMPTSDRKSEARDQQSARSMMAKKTDMDNFADAPPASPRQAGALQQNVIGRSEKKEAYARSDAKRQRAEFSNDSQPVASISNSDEVNLFLKDESSENQQAKQSPLKMAEQAEPETDSVRVLRFYAGEDKASVPGSLAPMSMELATTATLSTNTLLQTTTTFGFTIPTTNTMDSQ